MPWLPIYADETDLASVHGWLNTSEELAFIVSDGPGRWRAVSTVPTLDAGRHCLWHVSSGPLPLLHPQPSREVDPIGDPWSGWQELRAGAAPDSPFFGAGHPGIIWLNARPISQRLLGVGLSSFEWIGNHYRIIEKPADPSTEVLWRSMCRWVKKQTRKIPREGALNGPRPEIFAFPSALTSFETGTDRDPNP